MPLLEQLDWVFTSASWINTYPMTQVTPLAKTAFDHVPCLVTISTSIPKAHIFRFENFWVHQAVFMDYVQEVWTRTSHKTHISAIIVDKLKALRFAFKNGRNVYHILKG